MAIPFITQYISTQETILIGDTTMPKDSIIGLTEIQTIKLLKHGILDREPTDGPIVAIATGTDNVNRLTTKDIQSWTVQNKATLENINNISNTIGGITIDPATTTFAPIKENAQKNSESLTPIPLYLQKMMTKELRHDPIDYIPTTPESNAKTQTIGLSTMQAHELLGKGYLEQTPPTTDKHVVVEAKLVNGILLRDNVEKWTFDSKISQWETHQIAQSLNIPQPDPNNSHIANLRNIQANTTEALAPLPKTATKEYQEKTKATKQNTQPKNPNVILTQVPSDPTPEKLQQWQDRINQKMEGIKHIRIIGPKTPESSYAENLLKHQHINTTIQHITPEEFQRSNSEQQNKFKDFSNRNAKMVDLNLSQMQRILHAPIAQEATKMKHTTKNQDAAR